MNKKVAHKTSGECVTDVLTTFHIFCDLLLNRGTATWNLFYIVKRKTIANDDVIYASLSIIYCLGEEGWRLGGSERRPECGLGSIPDVCLFFLSTFFSRPYSKGFLRVLRFTSFHENQHTKFQLGLDASTPHTSL